MSSVTAVVGASRGIGAELVQQLAKDPERKVIATVRKPVEIFDHLSNVSQIILDQSDISSIKLAASKIAEIDTLIINAAIGDDELLLDISDDRMNQYFTTNVFGPYRIVRAFLPALLARKTRQIIFISSSSGSLTGQINMKLGLRGPYAVTKAAGNMMAVQFHNELNETKQVTVLAIHPGWVATDMGIIAGSGGMKVEDSVRGVLEVVKNLKPGEGIKFVDYTGTQLPW